MTEKCKYMTGFEFMIKCALSREQYFVGGKKRYLRELLEDDWLMGIFVKENPDEAFALYRRAREWESEVSSGDVDLFLGTDVKVGEAFVSCYPTDSKYGAQANDISVTMRNKKMDGRPKEKDDCSERAR